MPQSEINEIRRSGLILRRVAAGCPARLETTDTTMQTALTAVPQGAFERQCTQVRGVYVIVLVSSDELLSEMPRRQSITLQQVINSLIHRSHKLHCTAFK